MAFIGGKTLLFALIALAVFVGTKTARSVLVKREATTADGGKSADSKASVADRGEYEVETDSEMKFGEVNVSDGRQKRSES